MKKLPDTVCAFGVYAHNDCIQKCKLGPRRKLIEWLAMTVYLTFATETTSHTLKPSSWKLCDDTLLLPSVGGILKFKVPHINGITGVPHTTTKDDVFDGMYILQGVLHILLLKRILIHRYRV